MLVHESTTGAQNVYRGLGRGYVRYKRSNNSLQAFVNPAFVTDFADGVHVNPVDFLFEFRSASAPHNHDIDVGGVIAARETFSSQFSTATYSKYVGWVATLRSVGALETVLYQDWVVKRLHSALPPVPFEPSVGVRYDQDNNRVVLDVVANDFTVPPELIVWQWFCGGIHLVGKGEVTIMSGEHWSTEVPYSQLVPECQGGDQLFHITLTGLAAGILRYEKTILLPHLPLPFEPYLAQHHRRKHNILGVD